jgi:hypothetical protein
MFPHERSLVKNLASAPFALIGVNTDEDKEKIKSENEKQAITWRSFIDGSTSGPICQSWYVDAFPQLYLLDHKGVIRAKWRGAPADPRVIDQAIGVLLKEMQQEARIAAREAAKTQPPAKTSSKSGGDTGKTDRIPDEKDKQDEMAFTRLKFAKDLANEGKTDKAKERLQKLIKDFPKSSAAEEAKELLKKLNK